MQFRIILSHIIWLIVEIFWFWNSQWYFEIQIFERFLRRILKLYFELRNFCQKFKITVLSENWLEKIGSASKFSPSHWIIFFDVCWQWLSMITGERAVPHIPSWHSLNKAVNSCYNFCSKWLSYAHFILKIDNLS